METWLGLSMGEDMSDEAACFFAINRDDKIAWKAAVKLCEEGKPGAFVPLTSEEFDAIKRSVRVIPIGGLPAPQPPPKDDGWIDVGCVSCGKKFQTTEHGYRKCNECWAIESGESA